VKAFFSLGEICVMSDEVMRAAVGWLSTEKIQK
jgi:hypothetical protein